MIAEVKKSLILFLVCIFVTTSPAFSENFPTPPQLKNNVKFWTQVYTEFTTHHVIIHDSEHLNIIYQVIDLNDFFPHETSLRVKWRKIEAIKKDYKKILTNLDRKKNSLDVEKLSEREKHVYNLWAFSTDKNKFRDASYRLRGQTGQCDKFERGLERSGRYLSRIQEILKRYDLPEELCYLPHVESSFYYKAYSKMGAAGLWQFTRSTGRLFLKINYSIDERLDPIIATDAAARLLKKNYTELGAWPLAITAYNHGLSGMKRAKRKLKTDDMGTIARKYRSRSFGFASRNFYAEFLAAKEIAMNYERFFGQINFEDPVQYKTFTLPDYVSINDLSTCFNIDKETFAEYNPAYRKPILKSQRRIPKGKIIRLPALEGVDFDSLYSQLAISNKYASQIKDRFYKVQRGDNLSDIAQRAGLPVTSIMALNDISNPNFIAEGQLLELPLKNKPTKTVKNPAPVQLAQIEQKEVPGGGQKTSMASFVALDNPPAAKKTQITNVTDTTQNEPVLASVSITKNEQVVYGPQLPERRYEASNIQSDTLLISAEIFEVSFETPQSDWITVQPEETIGHYAEWLGYSAQKIRNTNRIPYQGDIQVGQRIRLFFDDTTRDEFHLKRLEFHKSIQEDFFSNYDFQGVKEYSVRQGDNIWYLCQRQFQIPFWYLARFNKKHNLLRLFPGDIIKVPVIFPQNQNTIKTEQAD